MDPTTWSVFAAIIEREGNLYVALCPELDVASQGTSIENALENLKEAVALFIETADPGEMKERRREHVFVTQFQAADGEAPRPLRARDLPDTAATRLPRSGTAWQPHRPATRARCSPAVARPPPA